MPKIEDLLKPLKKGESNSEKIKKEAKEKELENMGYTSDENGKIIFDEEKKHVVNEKNYQKDLGKEDDLIEVQEISDEEMLNYIKYVEGEEQDDETYFLEEEDFKKEDKEDFEDQDIVGDIIKEVREEREKLEKKLPEISAKEKELMLESFPRLLKALVHKKRFKKENVSEKDALELVKEVKDNFPTSYSKLIHKKLIPEVQKYNWKEEDHKGKKFFTSYYPNEKNPSIKYIHQNPHQKSGDNVFYAQTINKKGNIMRSHKGKGPILVFLKNPKKYRKK